MQRCNALLEYVPCATQLLRLRIGEQAVSLGLGEWLSAVGEHCRQLVAVASAAAAATQQLSAAAAPAASTVGWHAIEIGGRSAAMARGVGTPEAVEEQVALARDGAACETSHARPIDVDRRSENREAFEGDGCGLVVAGGGGSTPLRFSGLDGGGVGCAHVILS